MQRGQWLVLGSFLILTLEKLSALMLMGSCLSSQTYFLTCALLMLTYWPRLFRTLMQNNPLYPRCKSPLMLKVRYTPSRINREALKQAQEYARKGNWNRGAYELTRAYMGGSENDAFWQQFA